MFFKNGRSYIEYIKHEMLHKLGKGTKVYEVFPEMKAGGNAAGIDRMRIRKL